MSRDVIADAAWAVIGPMFPRVNSTGRPPVDRRSVVEATAWRFRTGAPWRDLPERFGKWNTVYKGFNRWGEEGVWASVLEKVQALAHQSGDLDWVASIGSTIVRVFITATAPHFPAPQGAVPNYKKRRSDKTARKYHADLCFAATLHWLPSGFTTLQPEIAATASISTN